MLFADTAYWIASVSPRDALAGAVTALLPRVRSTRVVTTQLVFVELLAFFSSRGPWLRTASAETVRDAMESGGVQVIPLSEHQFLAGLALYEARPDKGYSLVDCISMTVMRELGIATALTSDRHFEQEGFEILLK